MVIIRDEKVKLIDGDRYHIRFLFVCVIVAVVVFGILLTGHFMGIIP